MKKLNKIIYHRDMDGVASAAAILELVEVADCRSIQYGEEPYGVIGDLNKDLTLYIVDFSFSRELTLEIASKVKKMIIIDHHETAEKNLKDIENEADNIKCIFDMAESGATLCFKYLLDHCEDKNDIMMNKELFNYVKDRDLWYWAMPFSKEINEHLSLEVDVREVSSFEKFNMVFNRDKSQAVGRSLLKKTQQSVESKTKDIEKLRRVVIKGQEFLILNSTSTISEIGNEICKKYQIPSMQYFILENNDVVFSFRSINELGPVNGVAKALGGGGHPNACGATVSLDDLVTLLKTGELK